MKDFEVAKARQASRVVNHKLSIRTIKLIYLINNAPVQMKCCNFSIMSVKTSIWSSFHYEVSGISEKKFFIIYV